MVTMAKLLADSRRRPPSRCSICVPASHASTWAYLLSKHTAQSGACYLSESCTKRTPQCYSGTCWKTTQMFIGHDHCANTKMTNGVPLSQATVSQCAKLDTIFLLYSFYHFLTLFTLSLFSIQLDTIFSLYSLHHVLTFKSGVPACG